MPQGKQAESVINKARDDGYDAITFPDDVLNHIESVDVRGAFGKDGSPAKTTIVLNQDKLVRNKPQSTFYDSLDVPKQDLIVRDARVQLSL